MTSPRLGVVRNSMLTNPLLIKSPLGKVRSRGLTVPGPDFTFGTSSPFSDGGVAEALSSWKVEPRYEECAQHLDFVSLNRDAAMAGLVTSRELGQYRAQRIRAQNQAPTQRQGRAPQRQALVPDITFGVKNRDSSPISGLLSHEYGRRWLDTELRRKHPTHQQRVKPGSVAETRTSVLRRSRCVPEPHPTPPRPPGFTQVAPALNTFCNQEARQRALGARSDLVPCYRR